jgi:uncharacterized protein YegL
MIIPLFGIFLIVVLIAAVQIIGALSNNPLEVGIMRKEGKAISISNHVEFWRKALEESVPIIAKRATYELGLRGGLEEYGFTIWSTTYPEIEDLEKGLEEKIKKNLPISEIKNDMVITWNEGIVNITRYDESPCGPIENSKCFLINGSKTLHLQDKDINLELSVDLNITSVVNSSYFKLLRIGRLLFENPDYVLNYGDPATLENILENDFPGLDFRVVSTPDGFLDVTIEDRSCPPGDYCLVPLKPGEGGIINPLTAKPTPYDYLKLRVMITPCHKYPYFDVELVLDISGSMNTLMNSETRALVLKEAAKGFVDWIPLSWNWQVGVIEFNESVYEKVPLTLANTDVNKGIVKDGISGFAGGWTNIGDAIRTATDRLLNSPRFGTAGSYIILISDGAPTRPPPDPSTYAKEAANDAKNQGIKIITAGIDLNPTTADLMQSLATSPDTFINAATSDEIIQFFKELGMKICLGIVEQ